MKIEKSRWINLKGLLRNTLLKGTHARGKFYFRTAYRYEPDFTIAHLSKQNNPIDNIKLDILMANNQMISENHQKWMAQTLAGAYEDSNNDEPLLQALDVIDRLSILFGRY